MRSRRESRRDERERAPTPLSLSPSAGGRGGSPAAGAGEVGALIARKGRRPMRRQYTVGVEGLEARRLMSAIPSLMAPSPRPRPAALLQQSPSLQTVGGGSGGSAVANPPEVPGQGAPSRHEIA